MYVHFQIAAIAIWYNDYLTQCGICCITLSTIKSIEYATSDSRLSLGRLIRI